MPRTSYSEIEMPRFLGQNTALSFSEIDLFQSPRMMNNLPRKIGGLAKRDGTIPITTTPLGAPIKTLCNLRKNGVNTILAGSGSKLYKYGSGTFTEQTMTVSLNNADFDSAQFKDNNGDEVLIIADGGNLKYYDGTQVRNITPAANDASPLPPNDLANINTKSPLIGCIVHNTRVVVWAANSDTIHHSKVGFFDYFTNVDFQRYVRNNDYVQTCVSYGGALLVFMRRNIGVLFGQDIDNWYQDFLDTTDGCVNPCSVQTVVFPDGREEVFYQSDRGVHAVQGIDTLSLDNSARYSTRNVTQGLIDFDGLEVSKSEWQNARSYFKDGRYWLIYKVGSSYEGIVFDTNDSQWRPVNNVKADAFLHDEDYYYFAGADGHLKVFDSDLYSDWETYSKAVGTNTPIDWYWYSKLMTPKITGFNHLWDVLMIEAKQWLAQSTIDVEVNTYTGQFQRTGAIKTEIFVIRVSRIGEAEIPNNDLTDIVNNAKRIPDSGSMGLKGQYAQVKLSNNRDEPVEVYSMRMELRTVTKY